MWSLGCGGLSWFFLRSIQSMLEILLAKHSPMLQSRGDFLRHLEDASHGLLLALCGWHIHSCVHMFYC
jgi:hypothetical protein